MQKICGDVILVLPSPYFVILVVKNMQKYAKYAAKFAFRLLKNGLEATRACASPATRIRTLGVQIFFHLRYHRRKISNQARKFWLQSIVYHLEEPKSIRFLAISWQKTPATSNKKSAEVRESSANMKRTLISLCACEKFQWLPSIHGGLSGSIDGTQGNNDNMQVSKKPRHGLAHTGRNLDLIEFSE